MSAPKYKTYAELAAAFKSGELDGERYCIRLDKGGMDATLHFHDPAFTDAENDIKNDECRKLFDPPYADHLDDLYVALGIPYEWC